jgi:uncharacterized protein (TIGR02145 family)
MNLNPSYNNYLYPNLSSQHQGICPSGWHVLNFSEWNELIAFINSQPYYACEGLENQTAKSTADTVLWSYDGICRDGCTPSRCLSTNNRTGFSLRPAGFVGDGFFIGSSHYASIWLSNQVSPGFAYSGRLFYIDSEMTLYEDISKTYGSSVRCVKNY